MFSAAGVRDLTPTLVSLVGQPSIHFGFHWFILLLSSIAIDYGAASTKKCLFLSYNLNHRSNRIQRTLRPRRKHVPLCSRRLCSAAGSIELVGGTSDKGQGRDVDIRGGQSTTAGTGGRVLLGTYHTLVFFNIEIGILSGILPSILQVC